MCCSLQLYGDKDISSTSVHSLTPSRYSICALNKVAYRIFYGGGGGGGGTKISVASRGSGGMLPHKIFVYYVGH